MAVKVSVRALMVAGLVVTLLLAIFVSSFASGEPDGLEKVAEDQGFMETATDHALESSPFADYGFSAVDSEFMGTGVAGLVGVLITLGLAMLIFKVLRPKRTA